MIVLSFFPAQTIQIRPQTAGQPVQNLHFTQTPGGQLQVRGLLPGMLIPTCIVYNKFFISILVKAHYKFFFFSFFF